MAVPDIRVTIDEKQFSRAMARLERYQGKPLEKRARQAYLEGARLLRGPMQRAAPVGPTGNLKRSISSRANRLRPGEMAAATTGPRHRKAPHRWFVTTGTKAHSLTGVRKRGAFAVFPDGNVRRFAGFRHPGSKANPFVERVTDANRERVQSFIRDRVLDIGGGLASF
jgi:hypothetical protein